MLLSSPSIQFLLSTVLIKRDSPPHNSKICPLNLEWSTVYTAVQVYHWHKILFPVPKNEFKEIQSASLCETPSVLPVSHHHDLINKIDPRKSNLDLLFSMFSERIQHDIDFWMFISSNKGWKKQKRPDHNKNREEGMDGWTNKDCNKSVQGTCNRSRVTRRNQIKRQINQSLSPSTLYSLFRRSKQSQLICLTR